MDVIVDTCILFPDPFMRSNRFKDLFQHLRTTDSRLVILPIVFDEAIAKYERKLAERHKEASEAWGLLNAMSSEPRPTIGELNLFQETRIFEEVLKSGLRKGEPLPLKLLSDYSIIDVKEVAKRGIRRIPPSNSNGEELRDVMIWLASVAYSGKSKKPVAFISNDNAFWRKGKPKAVKTELLDELTSGHIQMQVYSSINDFLKSTAVTAIEIPKSWFETRVTPHRIGEILNKYRHSFIYGVWHGSRGVHLLSSGIEFNSGKLYDLGDGAQLAETGVGCQLHVKVSDWAYPPPEASFPPDVAREVRLQQQPIYTQEYRLNAMLFISLRLQDEKITDLVPERFEYDSPPAGTEIVTPPVFLRQSYP